MALVAKLSIHHLNPWTLEDDVNAFVSPVGAGCDERRVVRIGRIYEVEVDVLLHQPFQQNQPALQHKQIRPR